MRTWRHTGTVAGTAVMAAFVLFSAGCSPATAKVKGKVTYNGRQVTGGKLTFTAKTGRARPASVDVDENGVFPETVVPAGDVIITFDNRELKGGSRGATGVSGAYFQGDKKDQPGSGIPKGGPPMGGGGGPVGPNSGPPMMPSDPENMARMAQAAGKTNAPTLKGKYMDVPTKYYSSETSTLTRTIKDGDTLDLDLTD